MYNDYHYLYVEDDPLSREVMTMIMENAMGVEKLTVYADSENFESRVTALSQKPDIVLLDIHVKPFDGFEMLQILREKLGFEDVKIVALTASVMNEEVNRLKSSGFNGAIAKPLNLKTFPDLIAKIINGETVWHVA